MCVVCVCCVCVCMCVLCVHVHVRVLCVLCICACVCVCMHVCCVWCVLCVWTSVCVCLLVYTYLHAFVHVCIFVVSNCCASWCNLYKLLLTTQLESGDWRKRTTTWRPNSRPMFQRGVSAMRATIVMGCVWWNVLLYVYSTQS